MTRGGWRARLWGCAEGCSEGCSRDVRSAGHALAWGLEDIVNVRGTSFLRVLSRLPVWPLSGQRCAARLLWAGTFAASLASGTAVAADCRQALALALDVSGSVDTREYQLQLDGLVTALNDPEVTQALLDMPSAPVALMVFEWSGPVDQAVLIPWTDITSRQVLEEISTRLARTVRRDAAPGTALGQAMISGAAFLNQKSACWKRTLDISGDGKSNLGPRPRDLKDGIGAQGITINALVIGTDAPKISDLRQSDIAEISSYFHAEVIVGPDAFVETSLGFEDYARAMTVKLKRELDGLTLSELQ